MGAQTSLEVEMRRVFVPDVVVLMFVASACGELPVTDAGAADAPTVTCR